MSSLQFIRQNYYLNSIWSKLISSSSISWTIYRYEYIKKCSRYIKSTIIFFHVWNGWYQYVSWIDLWDRLRNQSINLNKKSTNHSFFCKREREGEICHHQTAVDKSGRFLEFTISASNFCILNLKWSQCQLLPRFQWILQMETLFLTLIYLTH